MIKFNDFVIKIGKNNKKKEKQSIGIYEYGDFFYIATVSGDLIMKDCISKEELPNRLRQMQKVYTVLKSDGVIYKNAVLPKNMKPREIKEAARFQFIDVGYENYEILYKNSNFIIQEDMSVLCAAIPLKDIEEFAQKYKNVYTGVELEPFALWRGYNALHKSDKPKIIIGSNSSGLIIAAGRNNIEFARFIPQGGNVNFEKIRTIDYYKRAFNAEDADVKEIYYEEYAYSVAIGCALAPCDEEYVNLLPEHAKKVKKTEFKKPTTKEIVVAGLIMLMIAVAVPKSMTYRYTKLAEEYEKKNSGVVPICMEVDRIEKDMADIIKRFTVLNNFKIHSYMNIVNDIRYAIPDDMILDRLDIVSDQSLVSAINTQQQNQQNNKPSSQKEQLINEIDKTANPYQTNQQMQQKQTNIQTQSNQNTKYKPNLILMDGKTESIKSIGLFVDNISQLPYVKIVIIDQDIQYDKNTGFYQFHIRVGFDLDNPRK